MIDLTHPGVMGPRSVWPWPVPSRTVTCRCAHRVAQTPWGQGAGIVSKRCRPRNR